ncbi:hypothetical protein [Neobacillus sp. Marseille-QA0830]
MAALAYEQEPYFDVRVLSDENLVELYVNSILEKYDHDVKVLEEELLVRRLFLVALEWYDNKKSVFRLSKGILS